MNAEVVSAHPLLDQEYCREQGLIPMEYEDDWVSPAELKANLVALADAVERGWAMKPFPQKNSADH
jgi:hypothetical protein